MREQPYALEADLQELLAKHPNLLAGDQMNTMIPRRWILVAKEVPLPTEEGGRDRWSVDHLFLDQDAIPTIVEVKRDNDSRIRREVVGQMLDYAANAVMYWPIEAVRAWYETLCQKKAVDPTEYLRDSLGIDEDTDQFWNKAKTNLQAGKIRLVFVGNIIPGELRRIVEFLNGQMDPAEVLAVEVKQFVSTEGPRTLIPRVIGQTVAAQQSKSGGTRANSNEKRVWDDSSFFQLLEAQRGVEEAQAARSVYRRALDEGMNEGWGTGPIMGSFVPMVRLLGKELRPCRMYTDGSMDIWFNTLMQWPPFDDEAKRLKLLDQLNAIPGVALPIAKISLRPAFRVTALANPASLDQFFQALTWCFEEITGDRGAEQPD